jgi:hypothetical protein
MAGAPARRRDRALPRPHHGRGRAVRRHDGQPRRGRRRPRGRAAEISSGAGAGFRTTRCRGKIPGRHDDGKRVTPVCKVFASVANSRSLSPKNATEGGRIRSAGIFRGEFPGPLGNDPARFCRLRRPTSPALSCAARVSWQTTTAEQFMSSTARPNDVARVFGGAIPPDTRGVLIERLIPAPGRRGGRRERVDYVPPEECSSRLRGLTVGRYRVACIGSRGVIKGGARVVEARGDGSLPQAVPPRTSRDYPRYAARAEENPAAVPTEDGACTSAGDDTSEARRWSQGAAPGRSNHQGACRPRASGKSLRAELRVARRSARVATRARDNAFAYAEEQERARAKAEQTGPRGGPGPCAGRSRGAATSSGAPGTPHAPTCGTQTPVRPSYGRSCSPATPASGTRKAERGPKRSRRFAEAQARAAAEAEVQRLRAELQALHTLAERVAGRTPATPASGGGLTRSSDPPREDRRLAVAAAVDTSDPTRCSTPSLGAEPRRGAPPRAAPHARARARHHVAVHGAARGPPSPYNRTA